MTRAEGLPPSRLGAGEPLAGAPAPWSSSEGSFVTTYHRQQGEVFVVSAKTAQRQAELWAYDVDEASWARLELKGGVRLDKPLAVVFLPRTKAIWVLDETRAGFLRVARLVRTDSKSGGIYRAEGTKPRGTWVDTSPFGAAFPYMARRLAATSS